MTMKLNLDAIQIQLWGQCPTCDGTGEQSSKNGNITRTWPCPACKGEKRRPVYVSLAEVTRELKKLRNYQRRTDKTTERQTHECS